MQQPSRKQGGFTLVEIAIVLVIIGLLLGGVLRGQEMIENSRVKAAANDMNGIAAAYNSYIDRYRRLPGDDGPALANLTARGGSWTNVAQAGDNNGALLANNGDTFNGGNEADNFFMHLRAAGFLTGNPNSAGVNALPTNPWGGRTGVTNFASQGRPAARIQVCMGSVPGKAAQALDNQLDDGLPNNGGLRATQGANNANPGGAGAAAATYNESQTYTVCRDIT